MRTALIYTACLMVAMILSVVTVILFGVTNNFTSVGIGGVYGFMFYELGSYISDYYRYK